MSLLEAGACGVPCVATDVSGVREIVVNGITGFLARAREAHCLSGEMKRLMALERDERLEFGKNARRRIQKAFGMDSVLDEWERLYGALLRDRPEPRRLAKRMNFAAVSIPAQQSDGTA